MGLRESALALTSRFSAEVLAGRYRLDALIGSGGAADVHRGVDLRLKRPVAVKVFRPGTDIGMEERFQSEAVILARLQHPALVTAYDAGTHHGHAYLVMQLIDGPTLKDRIAEGTLTPGETAALGAALAEALAHAHEAGVVHRDVKPSNIILDASGHPHLTDFGIARLLDATTHTATGALMGTAAYLSPEQVLGRPVGQRADIYALGLVLLECLTGRLEYDGGPLEAAIARLHRQPALPSSLPEQLGHLLRDMTALDEPTRPSAQDCATALGTLTGTTGPVLLSSAAYLTNAVSHPVPARDTNPTHTDPAHTAPSAAAAVAVTPKATPARRHALVAGGTAALATVLAVTLGISDSPRHQGNNESGKRTTSGPSAKSDSPSSSEGRNDTYPTPPPSTAQETSATSSGDTTHDSRTRSATAPPPAGRERSVSATTGPGAAARGPAGSAGPPAAPTERAPQTAGQAKTESPGGKAGKPGKPGKPAKEKKVKKAQKNEKAGKEKPSRAR
ncbi:protein kinase [Streptomyces sp. NPDC005900]|uniref:serine/threonine-protein kinase n=1 Tax=Streptomyces sp. NPDC005900 TaxID=3154569 RepID=UPI0033D4AEF5